MDYDPDKFMDFELDYIKFDFRDKPFSDFNPEELRAMMEIKRREKIKHWTLVTALLGLAMLLSYGVGL